MQTKFFQILKVKMRRVDEIEGEILDAQNKKRKIELNLKEIEGEILELKTPSSGKFSQISISAFFLTNLSNQKSFFKQELSSLQMQIEGLNDLHKEANIEYEKVKYLDDVEMQKQLKALKIQENKNMDEVGNLLFAKKKSRASR